MRLAVGLDGEAGVACRDIVSESSPPELDGGGLVASRSGRRCAVGNAPVARCKGREGEADRVDEGRRRVRVDLCREDGDSWWRCCGQAGHGRRKGSRAGGGEGEVGKRPPRSCARERGERRWGKRRDTLSTRFHGWRMRLAGLASKSMSRSTHTQSRRGQAANRRSDETREATARWTRGRRGGGGAASLRCASLRDRKGALGAVHKPARLCRRGGPEARASELSSSRRPPELPSSLDLATLTPAS